MWPVWAYASKGGESVSPSYRRQAECKVCHKVFSYERFHGGETRYRCNSCTKKGLVA